MGRKTQSGTQSAASQQDGNQQPAVSCSALALTQRSVGNVAASLEAELSLLNEGLKRRQLIAASRSVLELMQDTAHVMTKVCKSVAGHGPSACTTPVLQSWLDLTCCC